MVTKLQLAKLREDLKGSDPDTKPGVLIVEYEADGTVSINPLGWTGTDAQAKEFLAQKKFDDWVRIHNDIPRLTLPRPDGRTLKVFTDY